jgi:hypothetical protein
MSAAAHDTVHDDASGVSLAQQWDLEYREAYTISVDPRALSLLLRSECERLRAVPLYAADSGPTVAVAQPSEERFGAIRALTGEQTRFVLISDTTLDALLSSRMFSQPAAAAAAPPAEHASPARASEPSTELRVDVPALEPEPALYTAAAALQTEVAAPAPASAPVPQPAPTPVVDAAALAEALISAIERRLPATVSPARGDAPSASVGSMPELLTRLDATIEAWSTVRTALASVGQELQDTKRSLRDTKEQLSVAHADNDQQQRSVRALETEVAESRALVAEARARLQDAADALDSGAHTIEESAELL